MSWRLLTDREVSHQRGLALDDALTRSASDRSAPTLRLYTYSSCVLVGRFQRVANEVNLENCRILGIPINRRPSGGGAIIMSPDQLGIALVIPTPARGFSRRSSYLMQQCASGLINALRKLGIPAAFEGKNDLVTRSRKIAGLGLYQPNASARLFHASLLLDLDIAHMLKLLRTPFESFNFDAEKSVAERITTIRSELNHAYSMAELADTVKLGYEDEFGIELMPDQIAPSEKALSEELAAKQYSNEEWIFQSSAPARDRVGHHTLRTDAGLLSVKVIVVGKTVKSVYIGGDFVVSEKAVHDLESSLRWHLRDPVALRETIDQSVNRNAVYWDRISSDLIATAILKALDQTGNPVNEWSAGACFARQRLEIP